MPVCRLRVEVHVEGEFWAQVPEWPGCFAVGRTLPELLEALAEAVALYVTADGEELPALRVGVRALELEVESGDELRPARQELAGFDQTPLARSRDPHPRGPSVGWQRR